MAVGHIQPGRGRRIPQIPHDRPWPHLPNPDGTPVPADENWVYPRPEPPFPGRRAEPGRAA